MSNSNIVVLLNGDSGMLMIYAREYTVCYTYIDINTIKNDWHHVVLEINNGSTPTVYVYFNGVQVMTGTMNNQVGITNSDRAYIGSTVYGGTCHDYFGPIRVSSYKVYTAPFTPSFTQFNTVWS